VKLRWHNGGVPPCAPIFIGVSSTCLRGQFPAFCSLVSSPLPRSLIGSQSDRPMHQKANPVSSDPLYSYIRIGRRFCGLDPLVSTRTQNFLAGEFLQATQPRSTYTHDARYHQLHKGFLGPHIRILRQVPGRSDVVRPRVTLLPRRSRRALHLPETFAGPWRWTRGPKRFPITAPRTT